MSNGDSGGGGGSGGSEGGENYQAQDTGGSVGAGVDGFNFLVASGTGYDSGTNQGSEKGGGSDGEAEEQSMTSEQSSEDDYSGGSGETEISDLDSYENLEENEQSPDIDSGVENNISGESTMTEPETVNNGMETDSPQQIGQPDGDSTFLGKSVDAIKEDNTKTAGIAPESLMREHDNTQGNWSPHGETDKSLNEEFDPRGRLASKGNEFLEKNKIEREDRRETVKENLREMQSDSTNVRQERVSDQYVNQEKKQGRFTNSPQDNDLNTRGGGSVVSSADYLPKAEIGRHSNEKGSIQSNDKALMEKSPSQIRAEMVSAWNEQAVRSYKERLLQEPGVAGDLARRQYKLEHPGLS